MANEEQVAILKQGADVWQKWRKEHPEQSVDLVQAELSHIDLRGVNLSYANLKMAILYEADLSGANFCKADLSEADLRSTYLQEANFLGANLSNAKLNSADLINAYIDECELVSANLEKANLSGALLEGANLSKANFTEANLTRAYLGNVNLSNSNLSKAIMTDAIFGNTELGENDLSSTIGLETSIHTLPSSISMKTALQSKGKIPASFLRGSGFSDIEIEFTKLGTPGLDHEQVSQITYEIHRIYLDQPIRFYDCFISYNNKDQEFAQRLHDDLQNSGVRCWFAPEDMKIGDRIRPTIDHQIRMREKLIVILSENSIQSEWVGDEVEAAIEQEKASGKNVLFPISLDNAVFDTRDDWAAKIKRRRSIGNFSKWEDEKEYQKMFDRLLRDLKAQ